jgi:hypothetical protein
MFQRFIKAGVIAALAMTGLAAQAQLATTAYSATYKGTSGNSTSCANNYNIVGQEPTAAGSYPVFIYTVGTTESTSNGQGLAAIKKMAEKGYVAAMVGYNSSLFGSCTYISNKTRCIFNSGSTTSAIATICSRAKADCSKGIVTAGFSQGSIIATLARNFDSRVRAAYGVGLHKNYTTFSASCVLPANRALPKDRLRAVAGEGDVFGGNTEANNRTSNIAVTGYTCTGTNCLQPDGSGWYVIKNNEVVDGTADHCFMRAKGGCTGSQANNDANWLNGNNAWGLNAGLNWLDGFVTH